MNLTNGGPGASLVLPFGIGRRTCPGKKYTEMQLSVVVAKVKKIPFDIRTWLLSFVFFFSFQLLRVFKIEYVGPLETVFEFLIAPKGPVKIRFTDRS